MPFLKDSPVIIKDVVIVCRGHRDANSKEEINGEENEFGTKEVQESQFKLSCGCKST